MRETISETLTADHRRCDRLLALVEGGAGGKDWARIEAGVRDLVTALEAHFRFEEEDLFPQLEAAQPGAGGPTSVMRMEHAQMRQLLGDLVEAAGAKNAGDCLGLLETLHMLSQQHNAKEEAILYPMADEALGARASDLLTRLNG